MARSSEIFLSNLQCIDDAIKFQLNIFIMGTAISSRGMYAFSGNPNWHFAEYFINILDKQ